MQSSNPFDLDFYKLASWITPRAFRKLNLGLMVKVCIFPLIHVYNSFLKYREAKIYQLTITPQVCYLERVLNDRFDFTLRRIKIDDAEWHLPLFIYQEAELKPLAIFTDTEAKPKYLYSEGEAGLALNDFVVLVPLALSFNEPEMKGIIDTYKLFGTTYSIQKI